MKTYIASPWGAIVTHLVLHWATAAILTGFLFASSTPATYAQVGAEPTPALQLSAASISASEIVSRTNQMRLDAGLGSLAVNARLARSAQLKAEDMATKGYFAHENAEGQRLVYWLGLVGYSYKYGGENLAVGFNTAAGAMTGWKNSPSHYANIIKPEYLEMGVGVASGVYKGESVLFVVQHFGATSQLVIPVAENVELAVEPAVNPAPAPADVAKPDTEQVAERFIETANVPTPVSFSLVPTAFASPVGEPVTQSGSGRTSVPETTQAMVAIVVLLLTSTLYVELETNRAYWKELLAT